MEGTFQNFGEIKLAKLERYIMDLMYIHIEGEYTQEIYAWYHY
jgi:hypothetical protein